MYHFWYTGLVRADRPIPVRFYRLDSGREPVREWLQALDREARKTVGEDVKTLQYGWPIGMPLARKLDQDLWEVRSTIKNRIARIIFTVHEDIIVLLHGFIKKSQKTPSPDLLLAKKRLQNLRK